MFIVSLLVAAYGWLAEKQIAIDFARKELIGTRYLGALGKVYAGVLTDNAEILPRSCACSLRPKSMRPDR